IKANVGKEEEVHELVDEAARQLGGVDIFVGNAASGVLKPLSEIDAKAWEWTININARSILFGAQAAVPYMRRRGWGRILTVTSIGSRRVFPEYGVVGVSKAAIETVTRYLAVELAPEQIICNCISPGVVVTGALDFFRAAMPRSCTRPAIRQPGASPRRKMWARSPPGSTSDDAAMIVGQTIEVDGGYSLLAS
ncbi:MAG: SDR family oxidoreductase, partial [Anaerolineales bacterium]|nr:SDR family oxidoreductase [Anaerolineales bacterium]